MRGKDRLILFGRYPQPGKTKTRLIPVAGPAGAAEIQRKLTEKTLQAARSAARHSGSKLEFCYDGGSRSRMRRWIGPGVAVTAQSRGDLGERMGSAFRRGFGEGAERVILFGTDIAALKSHHLKKAFEALNTSDVVVGPSMDGGYWLMGMKKPYDLFNGISWGSGAVLEQTLAQARQKGLKVDRIDALMDIDTPEELIIAMPEWGTARPYISVIIPALNEEDHIESAIDSAGDPDAEIIVIDGGSTDGTVNRARMKGARVERAGRGRAQQQNLGASLARGEVLLFLHADTRLPSGYVGHVFETLMDSSAVLGAFRFRTDGRSPSMKVIEFVTNLRSRYFHLPYGDQALFVRKSAFESAGGFPEIALAEDLFLVARLSRRGHIRIARAQALTSARRWRAVGPWRTTLINQTILLGFLLRVSPATLARIYKTRKSTPKKSSREHERTKTRKR